MKSESAASENRSIAETSAPIVKDGGNSNRATKTSVSLEYLFYTYQLLHIPLMDHKVLSVYGISDYITD